MLCCLIVDRFNTIPESECTGIKRVGHRKTIQELEKEHQNYQMMESYKSLVLNHFENKTDEIFFSGVRVNGKKEGYCEVLTNHFYFKGFYKADQREGQGIIQIKSNFQESLGVDSLPGLKNHSVVTINKGKTNQDLKNKNNQKIASFQGKFCRDKMEGLVLQELNGITEKLFLKNQKVYLLKYHGINSEIKCHSFSYLLYLYKLNQSKSFFG